jgi:hypothetical protein
MFPVWFSNVSSLTFSVCFGVAGMCSSNRSTTSAAETAVLLVRLSTSFVNPTDIPPIQMLLEAEASRPRGTPLVGSGFCPRSPMHGKREEPPIECTVFQPLLQLRQRKSQEAPIPTLRVVKGWANRCSCIPTPRSLLTPYPMCADLDFSQPKVGYQWAFEFPIDR